MAINPNNPLLAFHFTASIYDYTTIQDESGAAEKVWELREVLPCFIKTYAGKSGTAHPQEYNFQSQVSFLEANVRIRTAVPLGTDVRVAKMRDVNGDYMFPETQDLSGDDGVAGSTIFEPHGSTPIIDHTHTIIMYETLLKRAEQQFLDGVE